MRSVQRTIVSKTPCVKFGGSDVVEYTMEVCGIQAGPCQPIVNGCTAESVYGGAVAP